MFNLNEFVMKTLKGMIGNYPDFQVREYALNWYAKGVLTEDDIATIDSLIEAQYVETEVVETEETNAENAIDETENDYTEDEYVETETTE